MPATNHLPQLVVARIGYDAPHGPQNGPSHPWRRTSRHGIVTVERAPGVARDAASRPATPEEREAREKLVREIVEAWNRRESSAAQIGQRFGVTRSAVLGIVHRDRKFAASASDISTVFKPRHPHNPPRSRPRTHETRDGHITMLLRTGTVADVAYLYDLSTDAVRAVQRRARRQGLLPPAPVRTPSVSPVLVCERVPLLDASHDQCRDLSDDGMCCGLRVVTGRSWCPEHLAVYVKPARRVA